ncbi:unnamed protein product [Closterium sp. Yama58-4]|nr:unnamed protein product [Closterium sp. Yama58-4]
MNTSDNPSGADAGRGSGTLAAGSRQGLAGQGLAGQGGGGSGAGSSVEGAVGGSTGGSSAGIRAVAVGDGGVGGGGVGGGGGVTDGGAATGCKGTGGEGCSSNGSSSGGSSGSGSGGGSRSAGGSGGAGGSDVVRQRDHGLVGAMDGGDMGGAMGGRMDGEIDGDGVGGLGSELMGFGAGLRRYPSGLERLGRVGSGEVGFGGVVSGGAGRVEEEEVEAELLAMEAAVEFNVRVVTCQGSPVRWHNCHVCVRPNAVLLDAAGCIVVDGRELRARDGTPVVVEEQGESLIHALIDFSPPLLHLSFIHAFLDLDPRAVVLQETAVRVNRWLSDRQNQHEVIAHFLTCDRQL